MEFADFQTLWEQRLLEVAKPFLDPAPDLIEGSGLAEYADGSTLAVVVSPGAESPARSGFYDCEIIAEYDYLKATDPEVVSKIWGQILEAYGDGRNGGDPLSTRVSSGSLVVASGIDAVDYGRGWTNEPSAGVYQFAFSAHLGIKPEVGA